MLGIIFIIIVAIQVYRTAKSTGRNPILWTVIAVVGFFAVQFAIGIAAGIFIVFGIGLWDWPESTFDDYAGIINWIAFIPSVIAVFILMKILSRVPDEPTMLTVPPPPTSGFGVDQHGHEPSHSEDQRSV